MEHMRAQCAPGAGMILDAKRGDIGSTAQQYAKGRSSAMAPTPSRSRLSPGVLTPSSPPGRLPQQGAFLLCRTSNPGGDDLQNQRLASIEGQPLMYEHIARAGPGALEPERPARSGGGRHLPARN